MTKHVARSKIFKMSAKWSIFDSHETNLTEEGMRVIETTQTSTDDPNGVGAIERIFRVRSRVIAAFGLAIPFVQDLGDDRWVVVAAIVLVALPYNLFLERTTRRQGAVPGYMPWTDPIIAIGAVAVVPELWSPVLMVVTASLALAATSFRLRQVVRPAMLAIALAAGVGALTQDVVVFVSGTAAFAGAAALAVFPIAHMTAHRHRLESENRDLVENIDAMVWSLDDGGTTYRSMTHAAARILGYPLIRLLEVDFWLAQIHPDDRPIVEAVRERALNSGGAADVDYRIKNGAGQWTSVHEILTGEAGSATAPARLRGVSIDVTARRTAELERALYGEVVERISTAIIVAEVDQTGSPELRVRAANTAAGRLFGSVTARMTGTPLGDLLGPIDAKLIDRARAVAAGAEEFKIDRVEGVGIDRQKTFGLHVFGLPGGTVGLALDDVTEAATVAAALRRQALHDGLTGLPNRMLLRDRLQYALADARRRKEHVALILLDLNHFKEVNDALGHQYGDRLLVAFADRLQKLLRECDTIARLGGDEFALLLTHATNEGASRVVTKVTSAMQEPFELDGVTVQTTASLGVALFPDHADDADLLTQRADVAMYNAKRGGGGWAVYSPAQDQSSVERLTLLSELHNELEHGDPKELTLHYQPIMDLRTDTITGAEALLRWEHASMGWLNPEMVVELAELSGLIRPLAKFVAREALSTTRDWHDQGHDLRMAINLSARNLYDRNLLDWLQDTLRQFDLEPRFLKCELTESQVMDDPVLAMDVISKLREIGIRTAIDDFGTGYSSLAYLRRLPVDEIKIDKSFVLTMLDDRHDLTIVRTVIDLAHNLDMRVLAEGVEDEATLEKLREFGCDRIQGYLIGRPMTSLRFSELLAERPIQPVT